MDIKRGPALAAIIFSGLVAVGVLLQAFSITVFLRDGGNITALDMHRHTGYTTMGLMVVTLFAVYAAARTSKKLVGMASILLVVGGLQFMFLGDTDARGGWVSGLHGLLAVVVMVLAVELTHSLSRARRDAGGEEV